MFPAIRYLSYENRPGNSGRICRRTGYTTEIISQDERWLAKYHEVTSFIETHHRNPSRYDSEERGKYCNWIKHNKKLMNAGEMKEDRVVLFEKLLELGEKYRRVNQYD